MKSIYYIFSFLLFSASVIGQNNDLFLKINPKIDKDPLVLEAGKYVAWNSVPFNITRLQYYVSQIVITHDGGKQTPALDVYLLTTPKTLVYSLGNYDIQNVESIEFYIGVNSKVNHTDPTVYPPGHPLGPQDPSMNWGWAAGYRFAAIEGYSDSGNGLYADKFEFHAIGDVLFTKINVVANGAKDENGNLIINLDANYNELFKNVQLLGGIINHGELSPNDLIMANFKNVFSAASITATQEINPTSFYANYVNPCIYPEIQYHGESEDISFEMLDLFGQKVYNLDHLPKTGIVTVSSHLQNGLYIMSFRNSNTLLYSKKLIIHY